MRDWFQTSVPGGGRGKDMRRQKLPEFDLWDSVPIGVQCNITVVEVVFLDFFARGPRSKCFHVAISVGKLLALLFKNLLRIVSAVSFCMAFASMWKAKW